MVDLTATAASDPRGVRFFGLTRQGVRDLDRARRERPMSFAERERGRTCGHGRMRSCCRPNCGHYSCPCGLDWDDAAGH